ncbi:MAG: CoA-binding protein [candidate division Zixibacteria bacterium]|nr:CoA-binding protein [candidate division Zixibacteria bacterium]
MSSATGKDIYEFLAVRRLAIIGVSRNPKAFSRVLFKEFIDRKYETIPVNPSATDIDGFPCYQSVAGITPTVEAALVMTSPKSVEKAVNDCLDVGVKRIWIYGMMGNPQANKGIIAKCNQQNVIVISDLCPFMFFPQTGFLHRFHGTILKIMGRYPT